MQYGKAWQVIALTIIWAVALIAFKRATDLPMEQPKMVFTKPQLRMFVQHVGCDDARKNALQQALKNLPWLGEVTMIKRADVEKQAANPQPLEMKDACTLQVEGPVTNVAQADFIQLRDMLRKENIIPAAIEFGGLPRYALQVEVFDLKCSSCESAAHDALTPLAVSASYYFTTATTAAEIHSAKLSTLYWLEKKEINVEKRTLTAFVKANDIARVDELLRAIDRSGLAPLALRVVPSQV